MTKNVKNNSETRVMCPNCGTEFEIPAQSSITVGISIGKDANLGNAYLNPVSKSKQTAQERIEALRAAGVDVSNLFAMHGANGGECIACNKDGNLSILNDDDPIFQYIMTSGTVPNRKLFRRWVMAQMFHLMVRKDWRTGRPLGITDSIHALGYEYTWKMLANELYAQMKMAKNGDEVNYIDRSRWFSKSIVVDMANHYMIELDKFINNKPRKKCKGVPYVTVAGKDIFVADLWTKLYRPLHNAVCEIQSAETIEQLYYSVVRFNKKRVKLEWKTTQCPSWIDAYKGSGAYFTVQNMIRFHNCFIWDDAGNKLDKEMSLQFIKAKAEMYCMGDGWRMLAVMKKCLKDNNIDVEKKIKSWRK